MKKVLRLTILGSYSPRGSITEYEERIKILCGFTAIVQVFLEFRLILGDEIIAIDSNVSKVPIVLA